LERLFCFAQMRKRVETPRHEDAKTRSYFDTKTQRHKDTKFFKRKVAKNGKCIKAFERIEQILSENYFLTLRHKDSKARSFFKRKLLIN